MHPPRHGTVLPILLLICSVQGCATATGDNTQDAAPTTAQPATPAQPLDITVRNAITSAVAAGSTQTIAVHESDGLVLITGQVLSEEEKSRVSNTAAFSARTQLRRLSNELRVVERIDTALAERDATLTASANALLATNPELATTIKAVAENAQVFLLGRVTRAQGDAATQLISRLQGVAGVRTLFDYTD